MNILIQVIDVDVNNNGPTNDYWGKSLAIASSLKNLLHHYILPATMT